MAERVGFQEVETVRLELRDHFPNLLRSDDGDHRSVREEGLGSVEQGTADDCVRSEQLATFDSLTHLQRHGTAAHLPNPGDAEGEIDRQIDVARVGLLRIRRMEVPRRGSPHVVRHVHVHVPEAGNQKLPAPVDHGRTGGNHDAVRRTHGGDPVARQDDRLSGLSRTVDDVDDGNVNEGERLGRRGTCHEHEGDDDQRDRDHG